MTNENWEHFWLNEGFTSFIEAKILGYLNKNNGDEVRRFHSAEQWENLQTTINGWGATHPYTCLVYRLSNIDPDDAYSAGKIIIFQYYFEYSSNVDVSIYNSSSILQRCCFTLAPRKYCWFIIEI